MLIYGAGLAGLLAGCHFQSATILEAGPASQATHKAVLRFRTKAVGEAVGIDFRKVTVRKGIWSRGRFQRPNIALANAYARKVVGTLVDRSIWNLETVERYVAPEDLLAQLTERCVSRIEYNMPVTQARMTDHDHRIIISTIPMNTMYKLVDPFTPSPVFQYAPIIVKRWRIPGADVFQTVYFPDGSLPLYRASITGDLLIAEFVESSTQNNMWKEKLYDAFGLNAADLNNQIETTTQRYGKILPIDDVWRHRFMYELSTKYRIFSLGRFGTWRNILLDDVLHDIAVIRRLMKTTPYERLKLMGNS